MKDQTAQLIKVLKTSISTLGLSLREVERRLKLSRGYLTRLFGGEMDLKVDHVTEIAEVIGVEPEELFRLAFPPSPKVPTAEVARLREALGVSAPPPPQPADKPSDLERILEQMVNQALEKAFANFISSTKPGPP
jgi:transcriptional regulator with XRE-family HTH domain